MSSILPLNLLLSATELSAMGMQDQSVETACILAELGADETSVAAALLKDTLLKSMMTEQQLRGLVANNVVDLVVKVGRLNDICQVSFQYCCSHALTALEGAEIGSVALLSLRDQTKLSLHVCC